jgi:hypothetical protein
MQVQPRAIMLRREVRAALAPLGGGAMCVRGPRDFSRVVEQAVPVTHNDASVAVPYVIDAQAEYLATP